MCRTCRKCGEDEDDCECSDGGSFVASVVIGAVTDSAILGAVLGGDLVGGILGDALDGDLDD